VALTEKPKFGQETVCSRKPNGTIWKWPRTGRPGSD